MGRYSSLSATSLPSRRVLALAVRSALLVMACSAVPSQAQTAAAAPAAAQAEAARSYQIAAGALDEALASFAASAGVSITMPPVLVQGRTTPGLQGRHTVRGGFARLLEGSGLEAVGGSGGVYTLRAAAVPAASPVGQGVALGEVRVTAEADRGGTTEGTGSYTTRSMSTATGLNLSMRETPQSVSVLSRQQIEDLGLTTLDDAVQNVTGLVMQKGYYVGDSGSFFARGFAVSNILLDGLPTTTGANGTFNADNDSLDIYDRVEVVRGATGLTTGAGTPSAAINLVRKRPTAERQGGVTLSAGSWNNYRAAVDASGPLNEAGTLRGRAVVTVQDSKHFYDVAHDRSQQLYGILEADLGPATVAALGYHYRNVDSQGRLAALPSQADGSFYPGLDRSTNLGNDFDYWKQTDQTVFADVTHQFANGWKAKAAVAWKRPEQDILFSGFGRTAGVLRQNTQGYRLDNMQDSYDFSLNGPFSLLGRTHELLLGASYRKRANKNWGGWAAYSWTAGAPAVDPYAWDSSSVSQPAIDMDLWKQINAVRQKSVYAATRLQLADPLKLILGMRVNWYDHDQQSGAGKNYAVDHELTPYAGLVYALNDNHSAYASWTEIFEPQNSYDRSGDLLAPITGTNYEAGIKGEYFGGRLNASLATFLVRQENRAVDDLDGPNPCPGSTSGYCRRAAGEVESKGFELEVGGALTPDWQIMAGYTYVKTRYTKDSVAANVGKPYDTKLPKHQLKLSTSYRMSGDLQRWRVGGSVQVQSRMYTEGTGYRIAQGGYAVVGLNASYAINPQTELRINVNNVFDRHYYQNVGWLTGGNVFGAPRNVLLTAHYRF
ncbi:Ferric-pseudobactin BN7/BN8 receptor [uncultured Comamonas sp.]|nr:Ferric-pseudobactin BN7/BN8 receptor [uncultured Comamonas sp.]